MNTKKYLKQSICALVLAIVGFSFSPASALAGPEWNITSSPNGNIGFQVGSQGGLNSFNGGGNALGGGFVLSNAFGLPSGSILGIITNLLFWLLMVFAILGIVGFVLSGIFYLLAGADEDNAKKGKNGMTWSIIGIIVGLSGFLIMQAVNLLLGGMSKNF